MCLCVCVCMYLCNYVSCYNLLFYIDILSHNQNLFPLFFVFYTNNRVRDRSNLSVAGFIKIAFRANETYRKRRSTELCCVTFPSYHKILTNYLLRIKTIEGPIVKNRKERERIRLFFFFSSEQKGSALIVKRKWR